MTDIGEALIQIRDELVDRLTPLVDGGTSIETGFSLTDPRADVWFTFQGVRAHVAISARA